MNSKIVSSVFVVAALGILFYDVCAGERVAPRAYICVGLLVAAQLINLFGNKTHKNKENHVTIRYHHRTRIQRARP